MGTEKSIAGVQSEFDLTQTLIHYSLQTPPCRVACQESANEDCGAYHGAEEHTYVGAVVVHEASKDKLQDFHFNQFLVKHHFYTPGPKDEKLNHP